MTCRVPSPNERDTGVIAISVRQLAEGRSNAVGTVTLATSTTQTGVANPNCASGSIVVFTPQSADAAAAISTTFCVPANVVNGAFTITHASTTSSDVTFGYEIRG